MISATYIWSMKLTTLLSVLWTWLTSLLTSATPSPTRWSLSRFSTSAMDTLKVFLTRSLILRTTLRLPLRLSLPGMRRSIVQTPTIMRSAWHGQFLGDLFAHEGLDDIAALDIREALKANAAFIAAAHLMHVFFKATQRGDPSLVDHDVIAQQPALGIAGDGAFGDVAASDDAHAGDIERLAHLGPAHDTFRHLWLEETFQRRPDIGDQVIDDRIQPDIHDFAFCQLARLRGRAHVKADDDGVGG